MKFLISLFLSFSIIMPTLLAQEEPTRRTRASDGNDTLLTGRVTVRGTHDPRVADAFKIRSNPPVPQISVEQEEVNYSIRSVAIPVSFDVEPIRAARMGGDPLDRLYHNHIRLGMGTSAMPLVEYFYNSTRSRQHSYGLHFKHLSASGAIPDKPHPGFSDNQGNVYYHRFMQNHTWQTQAGYNRDVVHSYGIPESIYDTLSLDDDDLKITWHQINASTKLESNYPQFRQSALHHSIKLDYNHLLTPSQTAEMNLNLKSNLYKNLTFIPSANQQELGIKLDGGYFLNQWDTLSETHAGLFRIMPYLNSSFNNVELKLGANTFIESDSVSSRVEFYPDIHLQMELIDNIFVLNVGYTGETKRNLMSKNAQRNPFIHYPSQMRFQYEKEVIYAGINLSIMNDLDLNTAFRSSNIQNDVLYLRDTSELYFNRYNIVYDSIRSIQVQAELDYQLGDRINITLGGKYSDYSTSHQNEAWNRPEWEAYLNARYSLQEKIILNSQVFFVGERKGLVMNNGSFETETLDHFVDVNLGGEYIYNKQLSGFINIRNLTANRYEIWAGYPNYGFQFMAGLTYSM